MDKTYIRNTILKCLKNETGFERMAIAETNGCNFSSANIAILNSKNRCQVYRLILFKQ